MHSPEIFTPLNLTQLDGYNDLSPQVVDHLSKGISSLNAGLAAIEREVSAVTSGEQTDLMMRTVARLDVDHGLYYRRDERDAPIGGSWRYDRLVPVVVEPDTGMSLEVRIWVEHETAWSNMSSEFRSVAERVGRDGGLVTFPNGIKPWAADLTALVGSHEESQFWRHEYSNEGPEKRAEYWEAVGRAVIASAARIDVDACAVLCGYTRGGYRSPMLALPVLDMSIARPPEVMTTLDRRRLGLLSTIIASSKPQPWVLP